MNKDIFKKIKRYITLSKLFNKTSSEIFDSKPLTSNEMGLVNLNTDDLSYIINDGIFSQMALHVDGMEVYVDGQGYVKAKGEEKLSRAQEFIAQAQIQAELSNKFDEYIELQRLLEEYFKAEENLTN